MAMHTPLHLPTAQAPLESGVGWRGIAFVASLVIWLFAVISLGGLLYPLLGRWVSHPWPLAAVGTLLVYLFGIWFLSRALLGHPPR